MVFILRRVRGGSQSVAREREGGQIILLRGSAREVIYPFQNALGKFFGRASTRPHDTLHPSQTKLFIAALCFYDSTRHDRKRGRRAEGDDVRIAGRE